MVKKLDGLKPSCRITLIPSIKSVIIKMIGNMRTQPAVSNSRATRMFVRSSCSANQFAYSDKRKNIVTAEQSNIPKSTTPLHNVLGSCIMIQAKIQMEYPSKKSAICNIAAFPLLIVTLWPFETNPLQPLYREIHIAISSLWVGKIVNSTN